MREIMVMSIRKGIPFIVGLSLFLLFGCELPSYRQRIQPEDKLSRRVPSEHEWIREIRGLEKVFLDAGIRYFLVAKERFREMVLAHKDAPGFFDVAHFFVRPDSWSWKKPLRAEALGFQSLMSQIESAPGASIAIWEELKAKVYAYSTGSAVSQPPATFRAVLRLYRTIAVSERKQGRK